MIKNIMFATDLGAFTAHSLLHVESLAKTFDAKVVVVHAIAPISEYANAMVRSHLPASLAPELLSATNKPALSALREQIFESLLRDPVGVEDLLERISDIVVTFGPPAAVILQEAERIKSDLIVIGSHGVNAIDGAVLGSVASKVLQLAKVPVYMVPMVNPRRYRQGDTNAWTRQ